MLSVWRFSRREDVSMDSVEVRVMLYLIANRLDPQVAVEPPVAVNLRM